MKKKRKKKKRRTGFQISSAVLLMVAMRYYVQTCEHNITLTDVTNTLTCSSQH